MCYSLVLNVCMGFILVCIGSLHVPIQGISKVSDKSIALRALARQWGEDDVMISNGICLYLVGIEKLMRGFA